MAYNRAVLLPVLVVEENKESGEMKRTITIDMDKKCSKCGKAGAIAENKAGLCLKCIGKILDNKWKKESEMRRWQ